VSLSHFSLCQLPLHSARHNRDVFWKIATNTSKNPDLLFNKVFWFLIQESTHMTMTATRRINNVASQWHQMTCQTDDAPRHSRQSLPEPLRRQYPLLPSQEPICLQEVTCPHPPSLQFFQLFLLNVLLDRGNKLTDRGHWPGLLLRLTLTPG